MIDSKPPSTRRVAMLTRELNSYRLPFFESSRQLLEAEGVSFEVLVGGATAADRSKGDPAELPWCTPLPTHNVSILGQTAWWQPALDIAKNVDLLITEQATKQLTNIPLSVMQRLGATRHCLWGHGINFQQSIEGARGESLKRWFTRSAHWFFSYTELSTMAVTNLGFPANRVTTFQNSTDVAEIRRLRSLISEADLTETRQSLGLGPGPTVGFLGALYAPKRTQFLLDAISALHESVPTLSAIIIGGGSDQAQVAEFARTRPWVHYEGPLYGAERVRLGLCSDVLLMPGMVGLNIVDGFALGLPTITTDIDYHSPEISYLRHGHNGWISEQDATPDSYASQVLSILTNDGLLSKLQSGAEASGDELGTDQMAEKFVAGVLEALDAPRRGRS